MRPWPGRAGRLESDLRDRLLRCAAGEDPRRGLVRNKAVYLAIGVNCAGDKEILGLWIEQTEGAKFWLR